MTCFVKTSFMYDLLIGTKLIYLQAANIYSVKIGNRNTRNVIDVVLVFLLLTLNMFHTFF